MAVASNAPRARRHGQRGITLFGLLFWAIFVGFIGYVMVRTLPTLNEYFTIQRTVEKVAAAQPATVAEARAAFGLPAWDAPQPALAMEAR